MTLIDYYKKMCEDNPKVRFRDEIIEKCGISYPTFYKWVTGSTSRLPQTAKQKISEITRIPIEELFPTINK